MTNEIANHPDMKKSALIYLLVPAIVIIVIAAIAGLIGGIASYVMFGICYVLFVAAFIFFACKLCQIHNRKYDLVDEVIAKHSSTTFNGCQPVTIRMSPHRTYMAIEFTWKGLPPQGAVQPQGKTPDIPYNHNSQSAVNGFNQPAFNQLPRTGANETMEKAPLF